MPEWPCEKGAKFEVSAPDLDTWSIPFTEYCVAIKRFRTESTQLNRNEFLSEESKANLMELKKMEPENKWVNLAVASCLEGENQMETFQKLSEIDPLRTNYYKYMMTKNVMRSNERDWNNSVHCDLKDLKLTSLPLTGHLIHLHSP